MRDTEILLREHVNNLGRCGDVVRVAPGYARNYLLPRGLATAATDDNKKAMARRRERLDVEEAALFAEIDARLEALNGLVLETTQKADDNGHLYGSVTAAHIAALLTEAGRPVEEKDVRLEKHLKEIGRHIVKIHLHSERSGEVVVEIKAEGADETATPEPVETAETTEG